VSESTGALTVDAERSALYAAEEAAFEGTDLEIAFGFARAKAMATAVLDHPWWPGPHVEVSATRRDAASSSCRVRPPAPGHLDVSAAAEIRLAPSQTTAATVAHELAHALSGPSAGHGPIFRRALLDVVAVLTNLDSTDRRRHLHTDQLAGAFADAGLRVAARRWPAPAPAMIGAIEL
jgi:hypothetical protein